MASRIRRSVLATPANDERKVARAAQAGADVVFLDLEDAVPVGAKASARSLAVEGLRAHAWGGTERAVRINALDTPWAHEDIIGVVTGAGAALDAIVVPKVAAARDVWWVDVLLTQLEAKLDLGKRIALHAVIESVDGVLAAAEIARSSRRLVALSFGSGDYAVSQGSRVSAQLEPLTTYPGDLWHYARSHILVAARAAGIDAIDAAFPRYRDHQGFLVSAEQAAALGYSGKLAIHPDQVAPANRVFAPTEEEIERARQLVAAMESAERAGLGAFSLNGALVDAMHIRLAQQTLQRADGASRGA